MESNEEVFCNFNNFSRFEAFISEEDKDKNRSKLFTLMNEVFKYGLYLEVV